VEAKVHPSVTAPTIASFPMMNVQGAQQVFDLTREVTGSDGQVWYQAVLPMRPNGTIGFIQSQALRLSQTAYRIVVSRAKLTLTLWEGCRVVARYPIGLGTLDTPTPVGKFYLISLLKPPVPNSVYGVYAYGLSAYSSAITTWKWGGVIGLHGTNDPSSIGKRKSHGCIRMRNGDLLKLVRILPLGTPIEID
jgi:lipoprotein-anchoring transpeptidase ErfK/SrfK